jgi:hypothetical protein
VVRSAAGGRMKYHGETKCNLPPLMRGGGIDMPIPAIARRNEMNKTTPTEITTAAKASNTPVKKLAKASRARSSLGKFKKLFIDCSLLNGAKPFGCKISRTKNCHKTTKNYCGCQIEYY